MLIASCVARTRYRRPDGARRAAATSPRRAERAPAAAGPVGRHVPARGDRATIATTMQAAALGKQIYDITDSELALGLLGLVEFLPALVLLPLTGSAADRFDRRRSPPSPSASRC